VNNQEIPTHALIDCGATGIAFMDQDFARNHQIPLQEFKEIWQVEVIDGRPIESGDITHVAKVGMMIEDHKEQLPMFVTKFGHYPVVFRIHWLRSHDVAVWFASNMVTSGSQYCTTHCHDAPVTVQGVTEEPPEPDYPPKEGIFDPQIRPQRAFRGSIVMLSRSSFFRTIKKGKLKVIKATLHDINQAIEAKPFKEGPLEEVVPKQYHEFLPLFNEVLADRLPPHRTGFEHEICLKEGETPKWGPLNSMSRAVLVVIKEWLQETMSKQFMHLSLWPVPAHVFFTKKPDGGLRFCIEYRDIKSKTIKNWYPLPSIRETLKSPPKARVYTKLDVCGAYNLLQVKEGDEHTWAFQTRYESLEPMVMQFGSTNGPADFHGYINDTIREGLDDFALAYLDDQLIYSDSEEEHVERVKWVMQCLLKAGLYSKPEKCKFHMEIIWYLALIISTQVISKDEDKVETVKNWSREKKTKNGRFNSLFEVQQLLGFCNYHGQFIPKYSEKAEPMTRLTKKDEPFVWEVEPQLAFKRMVTAFTTAPVLRQFDQGREVIVESDSSDYVSEGVLSQHDDDGVLHTVAYLTKKYSPAECNYDIYDKELMAIIQSLKEWRPECEGAAYPLELITDDENLQYFMTKKLLNRRQARWSEFLTRFDYEIFYRPGKSNGKADALTRRPGYHPEGGDERFEIVEQVVPKPQNLPKQLHLLADSPPAQGRPSVSDLMTEPYVADPQPGTILEAIQTKNGLHEIAIAECIEVEGRMRYRGNIYIADSDELRVCIIQKHHDTTLAGNVGRVKIFDLLDWGYYWKEMRKDVDWYVPNCHYCQQARSSRYSTFEVLRPLSVLNKPWKDISMDCVLG